MTPGTGCYRLVHFTGEQAEHSVAEKLAQSHTPIGWWSQNLNLGNLPTKTLCGKSGESHFPCGCCCRGYIRNKGEEKSRKSSSRHNSTREPVASTLGNSGAELLIHGGKKLAEFPQPHSGSLSNH